MSFKNGLQKKGGKMAKCLVLGGAGFIFSHTADKLIKEGHEVTIVDNLLTGDMANVNKKAKFFLADTRDQSIGQYFKGIDWVFMGAAVARTQWTVDEPMVAHDINITGTLNCLIAARDAGVKRFVFASSCIVHAPNTPYYVTKKTGEEYMNIFKKLYGLSTISLRYGNTYGSLRQSEKGPAINVLASLRKSLRDDGYLYLTGDGEQSRDFIHVNDIVRANLLAAKSDANGTFDICTGVNTSMNEVAKYFKCKVKHVADRPGDAKHLIQDPDKAKSELGFQSKIPFNYNSIKVYL